jgi:hypothetical protein
MEKKPCSSKQHYNPDAGTQGSPWAPTRATDTADIRDRRCCCLLWGEAAARRVREVTVAMSAGNVPAMVFPEGRVEGIALGMVPNCPDP